MFFPTDQKTRKSIAVELNDVRQELAGVIVNHDNKLSLVADKLSEIEHRMDALEENLSSSRNGSLLWKIGNVTSLLEEGKKNKNLSVSSSYIYTGVYGYKLKVVVYPNGIGIGQDKYMSLYVILYKTDYDALLPWPFKNKVKIKLLDLNDSRSRRSHVVETLGNDRASSSFMRPINEHNPGWGFPRFVSHDELSRKSYLRENSLFLKIMIQPYDAVDIQKQSYD